jgi:hypothetical protein
MTRLLLSERYVKANSASGDTLAFADLARDDRLRHTFDVAGLQDEQWDTSQPSLMG